MTTPKRSTCEETRDRLPDFVANALPAAEAEELLRHTAQCPGCDNELKKQGALMTAMKSHFQSLKPMGRRPTIPQATAEPESPWNPARWLTTLSSRFALGGAVAIAGVLLLIVTGISRFARPTSPGLAGGDLTQVTLASGNVIEEATGRPLGQADRFRTQVAYLVQESALVRFPNDISMNLAPPARFQVAPDGVILNTGQGHIRVRPGSPFRAVLPTVVLAVRGTEFDIAATENKSLVLLYSGAVAVTTERGTIDLKPLGAVFAARGQTPAHIIDIVKTPIGAPPRSRFLDEPVPWANVEAGVTAAQRAAATSPGVGSRSFPLPVTPADPAPQPFGGETSDPPDTTEPVDPTSTYAPDGFGAP